MSLRIGIIQINVTDLAAAWQFYVEDLGISGIRRLGPDRPFELALPNGPVVLVYKVRLQQVRSYPEETGVTLVLYTDDIRQTVNDWKEKGIRFRPIAWARDKSGIAETPYGPFIAFEDPFGNVHELLEPRSIEDK